MVIFTNCHSARPVLTLHTHADTSILKELEASRVAIVTMTPMRSGKTVTRQDTNLRQDTHDTFPQEERDDVVLVPVPCHVQVCRSGLSFSKVFVSLSKIYFITFKKY